jgi:hypothetical protein
MTPIHVFWTEPTGKVRRSFRCYETLPNRDPEDKHYCNAHRPKDEVDESDGSRSDEDAEQYAWDSFPTHCEKCGRAFVKPTRQIFRDTLYAIKTGPRAGEIFSDHDRPVGAMWDGIWLKGDDGKDRGYTGPDGISLFIELPDGPFYVDSQCSNCTMNQYVPVEGEPNARRFVRTHYCWQREGDPRTGYVNVGKIDPKTTCAAGAGSIWQNMPKGFHGFVYRGFVCEGGDFQAINQLLDAGRPLTIPVAVPRAPRSGSSNAATARAPSLSLPPAPARYSWRSNRKIPMKRL